MTDLARQGKLDPVIGRVEEIRRTIQVLSRRTKNNPVLIGEPGVGKTAIVEGLAERIVSGDVPSTLRDKELVELDMSALVAGAKYRGELPLEVRDLEDELEGLHIRIEKIEQDIKDYQNAITQKKGNIVDAQASLERYNKQLDSVANNREYDTLTKEIEFQTLEIELCNKKIKEAQIKVEEKRKDLEANRALLEDRQHALEEKRNELDEIMQETREEEGLLKEKAAELETKIEPGLLRSFKRIRRGARNGLGIVYVQRDACGGCFNKIPWTQMH